MIHLLAHAATLLQLVHWIQHALWQHGIHNMNVDTSSAQHAAWIETKHWIITIRHR